MQEAVSCLGSQVEMCEELFCPYPVVRVSVTYAMALLYKNC
jgi:hypothetical protein